MNSGDAAANLRPAHYWRLWLFDAVIVSAGCWFLLATQYGTCEFLKVTLVRALLPLIPVIVLVGGAGSTIFALTKVWIEKHSMSRPVAMVLLVAPAVIVTLALAWLSTMQSPMHRLNYICLGHTPASANHIQVAGYSGFLRGEWLAMFNISPADFDKMTTDAKLIPADNFEIKTMLQNSTLTKTKTFQNLPPLDNCKCFKRVFKEGEEKERGSFYAAFDAATSTMVVFRVYRD